MRLLEGAISNAPWGRNFLSTNGIPVLCLPGPPGATLKYFKVALDPRSKIQDSPKSFFGILDLGSRATLKYFKVPPGGPNRLSTNGAPVLCLSGPPGGHFKVL